jgi:PAS domain S-box-containing protein
LEPHRTGSTSSSATAPRAGEWLYRRIVETTREGIWTGDVAGRTTFVNPAFAAMLGYAPADLIGRPVRDFFHPESRGAADEELARREHGASSQYEARLCRRDGSPLWVLISGAPILDESGRPTGIVAVVTDVTARRLAEQAARRLNRALRTLSQCNQALVRAADEATLLQEICRISVEVGGYRMAWVGFAEDDEQRSVRPAAQAGFEEGYLAAARISWADNERGRGPTGRAIRLGTEVVARNLLTEPDYEPWRAEALARGYASSATLPFELEGKVAGALMLYAREPEAFDADELKLLRELTDDLAFGVSALRGAARRKQVEAQLLLADRMTSMGTLAAGVAHEINNPLSYLIANLDLLARDLPHLGAGSADPARVAQAAEMLRLARDGAERVRVIVRDLKTFSRRDEETVGPVDLGTVLEAAVSLTWNEIKHRARLVKEYHPAPRVRANEARLGQVFLNLLVNAAQAIEVGAAETNEIRIRTGTDAAGSAVVEVRDTGPGIPPELLGRIFDPFFTTKPIGVGTGLGLSICHAIVSALGGEIRVTSTVGVGSSFSVVLPAAAAAAPPASEPRREPAPATRGRVLVIDDEEAICAAITAALRRAHDVSSARTAREALGRIAAGERFDVIFCDLMMPEMSGMDFYAGVREQAPEQVAQIVFMTGGAFTAQAREFLGQVPNRRLEKPFDLHQLLAIVRGRANGRAR